MASEDREYKHVSGKFVYSNLTLLINFGNLIWHFSKVIKICNHSLPRRIMII